MKFGDLVDYGSEKIGLIFDSDIEHIPLITVDCFTVWRWCR